jgi:hypothetical protein
MLQEIEIVSDDFGIQRGLPDELRSLAVELYDAAFGARLSIALPNRISRIADKTEQFACLNWLLGFGAATQMEVSLPLEE